MNDVSELRLPDFVAECEVPPPNKNLGLSLLALLVGFGLLLGVAVAGGAAVLTAIWPDRIGMCDSSEGTCRDLTVEQIAEFSRIDLPSSSTVEDAGYARIDNSGLLFATVVLTPREADPLRVSDYRVAPSLSWASEIDILKLDNVVLYEGVDLSAADAAGGAYEAASGQRADGSTVVLIRVSRTL